MMIHFMRGATFLIACCAATVALADINPEPFTDPGYVPGNALSAFYFDVADDTTGVLDLEDVGGDHGVVVKLTANGPDPGPSFPTITAQAGDTNGGGWGGPGRIDNGPLWFAVDVQKGTGDDNTALDSFIWNLSFARPNGANILTLDGGLGTFRLKAVGATLVTPTLNLKNGWNQIGVYNDLSANPNTILYLNGIQVASLHAASGPLQSGSTNTGSVALARLGRGGDGDHLVGTMRFDNIITANEDIFKFLPGDVNFDGNVDIFDVNTVSDNWGTAGPAGDANGDGTVDIFDVNLISDNWNPDTSEAAAVPEPASWALAVLSSLTMATAVVRRKRCC